MEADNGYQYDSNDARRTSSGGTPESMALPMHHEIWAVGIGWSFHAWAREMPNLFIL
jgi:hypothetical protein